MRVILSETGKIITGNTPKTSDQNNYASNDIPFVKPSDISERDISLIDSTEFWISEYAREKARILPVESVLVTCIGIIGKVAITERECAFNQQINAIIPNDNYLPEYLAYAILAKQSYLQEIANAPVVPIINKSQFGDIEIQDADLRNQRIVVDKLNAISHIISLSNAQLKKLDELIKSRFVEMFGDLSTNSKAWSIVPLEEVAEIRIGPFGSLLHKEDYICNGHALVNPSHIIDSRIIPDVKLTISDTKYHEMLAYHLRKDDIVLGRRGEMGRCAVVQEKGLLCGTGSMIIRPNGKLKSYFLQTILSSPLYKKILEDKAVGVTMLNLNVPIVSSVAIPLLPVDLQDEFIALLQTVEQQKATVQKSIDKLETLKKSLMQEYFG